MASTNSTQSRSTGIAGFSVNPAAGGSINAVGATSPSSNLFGALLGIFRPPKPDPFAESGRMGTAVWGGYVENIEKDRRLGFQNRYKTASDILANVSIVAAGLRFFLNLVAVPAWTVKPAEDLGPGKSSDQAKQLAEFVQDVIDELDTSWSRIVRRSGMFKFHCFGIQEWTARRREDGLIGMADVEQRPQHTIERWELADDGTIIGMWQRWPQNGQLLFLPRQKVIYLVDDLLTDSPEGLGLFRHLVDPSERLRRYLKMEGIGYERDMRGLPVGFAPLADLAQQVAAGAMTEEQADQAVAGIERFIKLQVKEEDSALLLDSATYRGPNADGYTVSPEAKWKLELMNGGAMGFQFIGEAIDRLTHDMARILGVESLMLGGGGRGGGGGSRALSEDKSRNLYLAIDATVKDISEGMRRDMIGAVWALNGLDPRLMPKLHTEDVAFKDVAVVTKSLADMATAGAILSPDDPAINDVRDLLGISKQPDDVIAAAMAALALPRIVKPTGGGLDPGGLAPDQPPTGGGGAPPAAGEAAPKPAGEKPNPQLKPDRVDAEPSATRPHEPGPTPGPPGSPVREAGREGMPPGRRNRTSNSTPH
jgi:hypothetical protein